MPGVFANSEGLVPGGGGGVGVAAVLGDGVGTAHSCRARGHGPTSAQRERGGEEERDTFDYGMLSYSGTRWLQVTSPRSPFKFHVLFSYF